jgi:hypothetical protein
LGGDVKISCVSHPEEEEEELVARLVEQLQEGHVEGEATESM